jgi:hypothetical protein
MAKSESKLENAIYRKAISWAGQITRLAKSMAPAHLRVGISSIVEKKKEGIFTIRVRSVGGNREKDKLYGSDARAQEFGSGLRARRGPKGKILIAPRYKKALAFPWEVATQNPDQFTMLEDGRVLLKSVEHPGIEAANNGKGYLAPAINEVRKRGRENLTKELRLAILSDIRTAFSRGKKR